MKGISGWLEVAAGRGELCAQKGLEVSQSDEEGRGARRVEGRKGKSGNKEVGAVRPEFSQRRKKNEGGKWGASIKGKEPASSPTESPYQERLDSCGRGEVKKRCWRKGLTRRNASKENSAMEDFVRVIQHRGKQDVRLSPSSPSRSLTKEERFCEGRTSEEQEKVASNNESRSVKKREKTQKTER